MVLKVLCLHLVFSSVAFAGCPTLTIINAARDNHVLFNQPSKASEAEKANLTDEEVSKISKNSLGLFTINEFLLEAAPKIESAAVLGLNLLFVDNDPVTNLAKASDSRFERYFYYEEKHNLDATKPDEFLRFLLF